jgi:hypothetical protein
LGLGSDHLSILEEQVQERQKHLDKLLDPCLSGDCPKELLTKRKTRLEEMLANLRKEQNEIAAPTRKVSMTDDQLSYIKVFCAKIRIGLDQTDLSTKRHIIEVLDMISGAKLPSRTTKRLYISNV